MLEATFEIVSGSCDWGNITGDISNQTDLINYIGNVQQNLEQTIQDDYINLDTKISNNHDEITNHVTDKLNPHEVTKEQIGLGNADNTSDLNKPISTATQTALNAKIDKLTNKPTAGTYTKVTVTDEGLVSSGDTLTASDIPVLTLSKISDVTASAEEVNILDGATITTTELNVLNGITATTSELNILDGVTVTTSEINVLDGITASTTELNYVDGVTSDIQTQINGKQATITGAATSITTSDLTPSCVIVSDENGKIASSNITLTELNYLDNVTSDIQTQINGKQATISSESMLSSDLVDDTNKTHKFATSAQLTQIATNTSDIVTINNKIPSAASTTNQLADKNFVNSSISTNTANFIGTFENVSDLESYSGTVTNNDYSFVINGIVTDNGNDWASFNALDAYNKTLLTNFDYAWVINGSNFDLYRFDIITQAWGLRISNTPKAGITLNTAYNRYKATVTNNTVSWEYEYTLNNSSFTADQWAAINSGANTTNIGQIATNQNDISRIDTIIGGYGDIVSYNASAFATSTQGTKADTAIQTVKVNGSALTPDSSKAVDITVPAQVQANWDETNTSSKAYIQNKPTIPAVNNATLTIQKNGTTVNAFTANASSDVTCNISVPTKISDLTDDTTTYPVDKADTLTNLTATVSELNVLDGITATTTELNYVDGVTSNIQNQLDAKQTTANLVTSVSSSSTDSQYPSAKLFFDTCGDIETLINAL